MNDLYENKNSPYTFIYVSREYYDGKCLNLNRIGIGKSKEPLKRLKDHNSSSSKISVEVRFELIFKTTQDDKFFHDILKTKGYKQIKKEIFEGTENRPLTMSEIKSIIEKYAVDGPWIIKNNNPIKLKQNAAQTQKPYLNYKKDNSELQETNFINNKALNIAIMLLLIFIMGCFVIYKNN